MHTKMKYSNAQIFDDDTQPRYEFREYVLIRAKYEFKHHLEPIYQFPLGHNLKINTAQSKALIFGNNFNKMQLPNSKSC